MLLSFFNFNFHFQVSSWAVDLAKYNLENMLIKCATEIEGDKASEEILSAQKKSLHEVVHELVRQITSPNTIVREQVGQRSRTKKGQVWKSKNRGDCKVWIIFNYWCLI